MIFQIHAADITRAAGRLQGTCNPRPQAVEVNGRLGFRPRYGSQLCQRMNLGKYSLILRVETVRASQSDAGKPQFATPERNLTHALAHQRGIVDGALAGD